MRSMKEKSTKAKTRKKLPKAFTRTDPQGRLHGTQPQIGTGAVVYRHGALEYLDDGNGNVYDANEESYKDDEL